MSGDQARPPDDDGSLTAAPTAVELVIVEGPDSGRSFDLAGATILGRDRSAGIVVDDPQVSRKHASLLADADGLELEDLGSSNGTFVNGERIAASRLTRGDKLRVGSTVLEVRLATRVRVPERAREQPKADDQAPPPPTRL